MLEHIAKRKLFPKGGRVRVLNIAGHEVDTNNVVIAFVAAQALCNALGIQPTKQPVFDRDTGTFSFPWTAIGFWSCRFPTTTMHR